MAETGRAGCPTFNTLAPATGAMAATRSEASTARRQAIMAPFDNPVAYTRRRSMGWRASRSLRRARVKPTSSTRLTTE